MTTTYLVLKLIQVLVWIVGGYFLLREVENGK